MAQISASLAPIFYSVSREEKSGIANQDCVTSELDQCLLLIQYSDSKSTRRFAETLRNFKKCKKKTKNLNKKVFDVMKASLALI